MKINPLAKFIKVKEDGWFKVLDYSRNSFDLYLVFSHKNEQLDSNINFELVHKTTPNLYSWQEMFPFFKKLTQSQKLQFNFYFVNADMVDDESCKNDFIVSHQNNCFKEKYD